MNTVMALLPWVMAAVIVRRCFIVIYHMNFAERSCSAVMYWMFGLSYGLLFIASLGAAIHIHEGHGIAGDWLFLVASTGLILFDRRRRHKYERKIHANP